MRTVAALLAGALGVAAAPTPGVSIAVAPKGHYASLDSLPDWGGAWFVTFTQWTVVYGTAKNITVTQTPPSNHLDLSFVKPA